MSIWDDTRADWGARPGRSMYTEQASQRTAFMGHHVGEHPLGLAGKDHATCLLQVRAFQDFHMGPSRGWSDLGYNGLVCQHGRAIEGRGLAFVGAHCPGYNRRGWGIQFMTGGDEEPTDAAKARMVRLHSDLSAEAGRELQVLGHSDGYPTECPGEAILAWIRAGMPLERGGGAQSVPVHIPAPSRPAPGKLAEDGILGPATFAALQKVIGVTADGIWGPATRRGLQAYLRVAVDGDIGPVSVKALQRAAGAAVDGIWGRGTTLALQRALNRDDFDRPKAKAKAKGKAKPSGDLVVDGILGAATIRALQELLGVTVDGVRGQQTNRALQKWLGVPADGLVGPVTIEALQAKVGADVDGIWGAGTTKALQRFLNEALS